MSTDDNAHKPHVFKIPKGKLISLPANPTVHGIGGATSNNSNSSGTRASGGNGGSCSNPNNTGVGSGGTSSGGWASITYPSGGAAGGGIPSANGTHTFTIGANGSYGWFYYPGIPDEEIKKEQSDNKDGMICKTCKELYQFAEPNQSDGTLICWACRHGY